MRLIPLLCLLIAWTASADVYRSVDANGVVHYSDKPQSPTDKPVSLPPLQTYKAGAATAAIPDEASAPAAKAVAPSIVVTEPAADDTIRDAERNVPVSVEADLSGGLGIVYYLDGAAQNKSPTPSTAYLFAGVERGEHTVAAALVAAGGKEVARSPTVTFNMMPPIARH